LRPLRNWLIQPRFAAVTHVSTSISLIACLLMAVTGYLTFTDKTKVNRKRLHVPFKPNLTIAGEHLEQLRAR
jgi:sodium-coupled neutral amino acid transporter 11